MSLREQLLKNGLASKEQAKKAQREANKLQHQKIQEARHQNSAKAASEAEEMLRAKREADRLLNERLNEEKRQKEAESRAMDIMLNHDLSDPKGQINYYFVAQDNRIACIQVNEMQQVHLASGHLAIASFDPEFKFFLVSAENAEKIRAGRKSFVLCQHLPSSAQSQTLN